MARVALTTLGRFAVAVDGVEHPGPSTAKSRALLAYLIRNRASAFSRDALVEAFWPDADADRGRGNLKTALWSIRRSLRDAGADPDACIGGDLGTVRWIGPVEVDAERFAEDAARGETGALARYTGPFLEGLFDDWSLREREALEAAYEALLERSLTEPSGIANAHRLLERNPFNEEAWTVALRGELLAGRRAAARELLRRARRSFDEARLPLSEAFAREFAVLDAEQDGPLALPFIERDAELARIEALLAAERRTLILISGQAGIGKTSLLDQIAWRLATASRRVVRIGLVGESLSLEQLEAEFGAAPDDDEGSPGQRFGAALVARNPDAVFLVDDAHAIGGSVLDAVLTIARRASTAIATRPEGIGALVGFDLPPIDASVVLGPLPRAATIETLVATNRLSADEAATVFARCDGYPFAMNAFLRLMHGGAAPETLPDEIALVVERRLRSRGERTARVASIYAVEPSATPDEAAELLRCSEDEVLDAIDDLLALGIFTDDDDGVRFEHALFHEHARKLISSSRRKRFHEFFAERLGRRAEYGDPDRIAFHLASCDRHLDAARAYLRAGTLLAEQRRFGDARERFEAAVAATERDARPESRITRIEAYAANARALMALGLYYPACAAIGAARELLTPDDDEGLQADVLVAAASAHNFIEETQRAEGFAREALRHAYASRDERRIAHCATIGANVTTRAEAPSGPAFVAEATEAARRIGDESAELNALLVRAFEIVRAGRYAEAMRLVNDDAMRIRIADPLMVARRLLVQSTLDLVVHRRAEARTKAREALALIESVQPGRWTPNPAAAPERMRYHALRFIAGCASLLGEHDEAISIGEAALTSPVCAVASEYAHTADFLIKSLLLRGLAGDRERARRLLERRPSGDVANAAAFICADEALVAAAFGEHAAVEERVRHAFDLVDRFWTIDAHELDEFYAMLARASAQAGLSALAAAAVERGAEAFDVRRQQSAEYWGGPERYAVELPGALLRPS